MTLITPNPPQRISPNTYRFTWSDVGGPYYVWHHGQRITRTDRPTIDIFEIDASLVPMIEVATDPDDQPMQRRNPERMVLQWRRPEGGPTVAYYRVELSDGTLEDVVSPSPHRYELWTSNRLGGDTAHERRIVPVLVGGHTLAPVAFEILIVRMPDLPRTTVSFDSQTGNVTIAAE